MDINTLQSQIPETGSTSLPPVDKWNPPFCGDMPLIIKANGEWWHAGTPFTRANLIRLFASVIKMENNSYYLVTPVEKIGIQVEDVPFVIIDSDTTENGVKVITQVGDKFVLDKNHKVELRQFRDNLVPYVNVRRNLWARLHQNVLYRWVDQADVVEQDDTHKLFINSAGLSICIGEYFYSNHD